MFVPNVPLPDPATATRVSLAQLLAYADANAPAVRVARARSERGEAEVAAASPILQNNPMVGLGVGGRIIGSNAYLETEVTVRQRVEIAGERRLRLDTAKRTRELALAELDETRWSVHVEVHALFLEALVARERVEAAERVVRFAEELQRIATRRVEAGEDSPLSRLVAQAELAQARERLVDAQRREAAARTRLAVVAGWPADRCLVLDGTLPPVRRTRKPEDLVHLAARHHPSFRVRSIAVARAESRVRLEKREAWPEPMFGLTYAREGGPSPQENIWLFNLRVPIPVWNRNQGGKARAKADLGVARAERDALRASWKGQLVRAAANVDAAAERVEIYGADVLPTVDRNLELIRRAYELGEVDIHAVSQTRERVLDSQQRALDARGAYYRALAELERLVGTEIGNALQEEVAP